MWIRRKETAIPPPASGRGLLAEDKMSVAPERWLLVIWGSASLGLSTDTGLEQYSTPPRVYRAVGVGGWAHLVVFPSRQLWYTGGSRLRLVSVRIRTESGFMMYNRC